MAVLYGIPGSSSDGAKRNQTQLLHAAAFATADGEIVLAREDIGRQNALDKLAGALVIGEREARSGFIVLSSRLSVEMVLKSARIGAPLVAAVSAPSDLALEKAAEAGMTVVCMAGDDLMVFGDKPT